MFSHTFIIFRYDRGSTDISAVLAPDLVLCCLLQANQILVKSLSPFYTIFWNSRAQIILFL